MNFIDVYRIKFENLLKTNLNHFPRMIKILQKYSNIKRKITYRGYLKRN